MINVLIRVNASPATGLGNISRCLELAGVYLKFGNVKFWSDDEIVRKYAAKFGLETLHFAKDLSAYTFDLLLIDTKEPLTSSDVLLFRKFAKRIAFMENISEAAIHSDMIIFPNAHYSRQSVFGDVKVQKLPKIIEGWKYVIIRKEVKDTPVRRGGGIVVTTGGSDPQNVAGKLVNMLAESERKITFMLGKYYIHTLKSVKNNNIVFEKFNLITLSAADIVITFGMSTYEGYLKPTISIAHSHEMQWALI